jgi:hypothetical protein
MDVAGDGVEVMGRVFQTARSGAVLYRHRSGSVGPTQVRRPRYGWRPGGSSARRGLA